MNIKQILESNGMQSFYNNEPNTEYPFQCKKVFQKLSEDFHRTSFETMRGERSKLRTYSLFKTTIGIEKYLTETRNTSDRIAVTKFRFPNHRLMIEVGRYEDTPEGKDVVPSVPMWWRVNPTSCLFAQHTPT